MSFLAFAQPGEDAQRKAKLAAERLLQQGQPPSSTPPLAPQAARAAKLSAEAMHALIAGTGASGPAVTGKPFSAEAVIETVQTLADGNRIAGHNVTRLYRDHSGRTRREQTIKTLGPLSPIAPVHVIVVSDPVAGADYIFDPVRKTMRKFPHYEVSAAAPASGDGLGSRHIEGLECTGLRSTRTVSAGQLGNERSILIVTESWFAPAIEALVRSHSSDPRFGQTSYSLHQVTLGEPPRELFEPPAGYRLEFEGRPGVMRKQQ